MNKLLPCPFCGGEAETIDPIYTKPGITPWGIVRCQNCGVEITSENGEEAAITAWNRRAHPENKPLTLDELLEMDGGPVWIDGDKCEDGWLTGWYLIKGNHAISFDCNGDIFCILLSKKSKVCAYRIKPKEDTYADQNHTKPGEGNTCR